MTPSDIRPGCGHQGISRTVHNALPEHSTCFRYGGEEFFTVIIQNESEAGIRVLADDLLAYPTQLRFENLTVSIGIKHATQALGSVEDGSYNDADQALYSSKKKGQAVYLGLIRPIRISKQQHSNNSIKTSKTKKPSN